MTVAEVAFRIERPGRAWRRRRDGVSAPFGGRPRPADEDESRAGRQDKLSAALFLGRAGVAQPRICTGRSYPDPPHGPTASRPPPSSSARSPTSCPRSGPPGSHSQNPPQRRTTRPHPTERSRLNDKRAPVLRPHAVTQLAARLDGSTWDQPGKVRALERLTVGAATLCSLFGAGRGGIDGLSQSQAATGGLNPDELFRLGQFKEADRGYRRLLRQNPDNAHALARRGYIALISNRFDDAETFLSRAVELAPEDTFSKRQLADTFVRQDQLARAVPLLRELDEQSQAWAAAYAA
jgi:hypothetical protein